jgi:hypothetical protein
MKLKINNKEAIGDIKPVNEIPNLSIFSTKIFSILIVKLKK